VRIAKIRTSSELQVGHKIAAGQPRSGFMPDSIRHAMKLHREGRLREAESGYRKCLEQNPDHPDALHLLGVIAHQCGHDARALALIGRAIRINSDVAAYHFNLADVQRALGALRDAAESYQNALAVSPDYPEAHHNLGLVLLTLGEARRAEASFRQAVQRRPEFAMAWNSLGHALRNQGCKSDAVDAYREAVRLAPDFSEARNNLGQVLLQFGAAEEALSQCREAVRLCPESAETHNNLGNALRQVGDYDAARACYEESLRLAPKNSTVYNNMAQLLQERGRLDEAVTWYQKALALAPQTPHFHCDWAKLSVQKLDFDDAIDHYRQALAIHPDNPQAHDGLGQVYRDTAHFEDAIAEFRTAIRLQPDFAAAHTNLGQTLAELGDLKQAERCYRDAIEIDHKETGAWVNLATYHTGSLTDEDIQHIQTLLNDPLVRDDTRAALQSALAYVFDSRAEYAWAAQYSRSANRQQAEALQRRNRSYDPDQHTAFVDELIECFDEQYFGRTCNTQDAWGSSSEVPVFVVGMPRSGTTLTEQILASHPQVYGAGEQRIAVASLESAMSDLGMNRTLKQRLAGLTSGGVAQLAETILEQLTGLDPEAACVIDKMPDNYLYLGWITTLFPRSRFVHCRRNSSAIAFSCWLTGFKGIRWASDPAHIAHRIENYQRVMRHWERCVPNRVLAIDYEELVSDVPTVARRLLDHVGLPWDERCVEFHRTTRPVSTASVTQVRQPVYQRSMARWKQYEQHIPELFAALRRAAVN
jgi:tetratricopeptide (TPR) repeat protein